MEQAQVTIIGLGLIGTSLGLALQEVKTNFQIVGHDREFNVAKKAAKLGAVDRAEWNLISAVEDADLIFLAIPVTGIRDTLQAIANDLKQGALITDTASAKQQVMAWAEELLPDHVNFVGGDPIVKRIGRGQAGASADLFRGSPYCVAPARSADEESVRVLVQLISGLGAEPYFVDAAEHDGLVAGIAHLPIILSAAMVRAVTQSAGEHDLKRMAGQEFRSITEFPSGDPAIFSDVCLTNGDNIIRWIDRMIAELHDWRDIINSQDAEQLEELFIEVLETRARWIGEIDTPSSMQEALDNTGGGLRSMLFGSRLGRPKS
ncbi:MAG: prephenate dehydrogenase [Anaerolineae bacterium]